MYLDKLRAIKKLNEFGENKTPCLFICDFDANRNIVLPVDELITNNIYFNFEGFGNLTETCSAKILLEPEELNFALYQTAFNQVMAEIQNGNTFLINLTFEILLKNKDTLLKIYQSAKARYKILFQDHWCCFSPEPFIKTQGQKISTFPMKGTTLSDTADNLHKLHSNTKETDEHATIVDLMRSDLSRIAREVQLEEFRFAEKLSAPDSAHFQTSSKISGVLDSDWRSNLGSILFTLLPAGSVSGAPKIKTVEIIKHVERYDRGFYTGVAGYFDGENLNSAVLIRFIQKRNNSLYFKAGGGITSQSTASEEYREILRKIYIPA